MLLKNVLIRRGIAFLEPATVDIYVGSQTEEREAVQDRDFARGLRVRLGYVKDIPICRECCFPADHYSFSSASPRSTPRKKSGNKVHRQATRRRLLRRLHPRLTLRLPGT